MDNLLEEQKYITRGKVCYKDALIKILIATKIMEEGESLFAKDG